MSIITKRLHSLEILTAEGISVPHCFTTRLGGVSTGSQASLNLAYGRGDSMENVEKNLRILTSALDMDLDRLVLTRQTHSDIVRAVTAADAQGFDNHTYPECDALITNTPGTALAVFTADCTPVLLYDPVTGAVGAAHAGWRGTAAGIAEKTALAMQQTYGCQPENIRAAIGPNIAQCCFQTDLDVPQAMLEAYGTDAREFIRPSGNKYYVNLKMLNALSLKQAGVVSIEISDLCTACQPDRFWSHRITGGNRGSQGAIIVCKEASL